MSKELLQKLTNIVEANLSDEKFGPEDLAKQACMSRSNLHLKLKSICSQNSSQFIREIRLKKAKELLLNEEASVAEISYRVGFGSPTYFIQCFHQYFGYTPGEFKIKELNGYTNNNIESSLTSEIEEKVFDNLQKPQPFGNKWWSKGLILSATGVLILVFLTLNFFFPFFNDSKSRLDPDDKSIAVLPFKNLSDDTNKQYFADGMMEEILNHLNQIGELRVISRTSVEQFRGNITTVHEIAKKLDVNFILEGSVLQNGGKVRIMIKLIDARLDQYILTEHYDTELSDIFQIQNDIAKQVASALNVVISSKVIKRIEKIDTRNMEAYSYYLKGIYFLNRRTREDVDNTINY